MNLAGRQRGGAGRLSVAMPLCVLLAAGRIPDAVAASSSLMPVWWDEVRMESTPALAEAGSADEFLDVVEQSGWLRGRAYEGWALIGPFRTHGEQTIETVYPPEERISRKPVEGKTGEQITWVEWKEGHPCPLDQGEPDAVYYALHPFRVNDEQGGYLVLWADDAARVWLDGEEVARHEGATSRDTVEALTLAAGEHQWLVKIWQKDGTWAFRLGWSREDPRRMEIKLRTVAWDRYAEDAAAQRENGRTLVELYGLLGEAAMARAWRRETLHSERDLGELGRYVADSMAAATGEVAAAILLDDIEGLYLREPDGPRKDALAKGFLDVACARGKAGRASSFLLANGLSVTPEMAVTMLGVSVRNGDLERSRYWVRYMLRREEDRMGALPRLVAAAEDGAPAAGLAGLYLGIGDAAREETDDVMREALAAEAVHLGLEAGHAEGVEALWEDFGWAVSADEASRMGQLYAAAHSFEKAGLWLQYVLAEAKQPDAAAAVVRDAASNWGQAGSTALCHAVQAAVHGLADGPIREVLERQRPLLLLAAGYPGEAHQAAVAREGGMDRDDARALVSAFHAAGRVREANYWIKHLLDTETDEAWLATVIEGLRASPSAPIMERLLAACSATATDAAHRDLLGRLHAAWRENAGQQDAVGSLREEHPPEP